MNPRFSVDTFTDHPTQLQTTDPHEIQDIFTQVERTAQNWTANGLPKHQRFQTELGQHRSTFSPSKDLDVAVRLLRQSKKTVVVHDSSWQQNSQYTMLPVKLVDYDQHARKR